MNDIFELEKQKCIKESKVQSLKKRIELQRSRLEPNAVDTTKEIVQGSRADPQKIDVYAAIVEMEKDIDYVIKELDIINEDINTQYQIFKKFNDEEQQIYIEKKLWKWSNARISVNHKAMSDRTIQRIVKKISDCRTVSHQTL